MSPNFTEGIINLISKRQGCLDVNIPTRQWSAISFRALQFYEWTSLMEKDRISLNVPTGFYPSKSLNTSKFRSHSLYISDVVSLTPEPQATSVKLLDRGKRQGQDIIPSPIFMLVLVHFMIASRTQPLQRDKTQHPRVFSSKGYFIVFIFRVRINGMGNPYIPIHRCVKSHHILYVSRSMDTCFKKMLK